MYRSVGSFSGLGRFESVPSQEFYDKGNFWTGPKPVKIQIPIIDENSRYFQDISNDLLEQFSGEIEKISLQ